MLLKGEGVEAAGRAGGNWATPQAKWGRGWHAKRLGVSYL